jgi:hypothetical protein
LLEAEEKMGLHRAILLDNVQCFNELLGGEEMQCRGARAALFIARGRWCWRGGGEMVLAVLVFVIKGC